MQQGKKKNTADGSVSTVLQVNRDNILKRTRRNLQNIYLFVCFTFKVRFLGIAVSTDWQKLVITIHGQPGTSAPSTHDGLLRAEALGAGPCEWGRLLYFWTGDQFCVRSNRWAESDLTEKASVQRGQQSARCLAPIDTEPCHISGDLRSDEKITLGEVGRTQSQEQVSLPNKLTFENWKTLSWSYFYHRDYCLHMVHILLTPAGWVPSHFFVARVGRCYLAGSAKVGSLPYQGINLT